ncbi:hypothetical protein BJ170DRAFT_640053 [Xylariales sp. AK1849]|nr:hypothetical protein BJ170DRAFT_640053 [Xylariales sp. AK1849]
MASKATSMDTQFGAALASFKKKARLTQIEESEFKMTSLASLQDVIRNMEQEQEKKRRLMYMKRLDPFLKTMEEYGKIIEIFVNTNDVIAFVWGPMKYILMVASTYSDALHGVLDAYQEIGEQMPLLIGYQQLFTGNSHMRQVLEMIYYDILEFHREAIKHFKQKVWKQVFQATWRGFISKIKHIKDNMRRHKQLIESRATIMQFEEVQLFRQTAEEEFKKRNREETDHRRQVVTQWLSPFNPEDLQESYREIRSMCPDAGRWLIDDDHRFKQWFDPKFCLTPLLWVSGIPGAGKTILASVVVDEVRKLADVSIAYFYCKHRDNTRNSFLSVAKSVLAQLLQGNKELLPYFHEKASISPTACLSSMAVAKELLGVALNSGKTTYVILDGLDECERPARKELSTWFKAEVESTSSNNTNDIRCLFISQDDGVARKDLGQVPSIKITSADTRSDMRAFASTWHVRIEKKFGVIPGGGHNFTQIIMDRAKGMFLFAKLLAEFMIDQPSRDALIKELDPTRLPIKLDDMYDRILGRIKEARTESFIRVVRQVIGWIVCAKRPLRWREIQGAVSIDLDSQDIDVDKRLLEMPKGLFSSLVEVQADDTVELIHGTARDYLLRTKFIEPQDTDFSLTVLTMAYLGYPYMDRQKTKDEIEAPLLRGCYAFYEYAVVCWMLHLQAAMDESKDAELGDLFETIETFIELHWSESARKIIVAKSVQEKMSTLSELKSYDKILQVVAWSRKQLDRDGQGPQDDEALDLVQVTTNIRSTLEGVAQKGLDGNQRLMLEEYYGAKWFKCHRINCHYFHEGFSDLTQRENHISRHERPFICIVDDCHMSTFGCTTEDALKKHLFEYHGIDMLADVEFPKAPAKETTANRKHPGVFSCHMCPKTFTRKFNLDGHVRSHTNERPFACKVCAERFTRRSDCDRHERGHGEKVFSCLGQLDDGSSWGCKTCFSRQDKLGDHLKSKTGLQCIRPLILQQLRHGQHTSNGDQYLNQQLQLDAESTISLNILPTFGEFLQLCGLQDAMTLPERVEADPQR